MRAFGDISSLAAIAAPQTKYPQIWIENVAASVLVTSVSALLRNNGVLCLLGTHVPIVPNSADSADGANGRVYVSPLCTLGRNYGSSL